MSLDDTELKIFTFRQLLQVVRAGSTTPPDTRMHHSAWEMLPASTGQEAAPEATLGVCSQANLFLKCSLNVSAKILGRRVTFVPMISQYTTQPTATLISMQSISASGYNQRENLHYARKLDKQYQARGFAK